MFIIVFKTSCCIKRHHTTLYFVCNSRPFPLGILESLLFTEEKYYYFNLKKAIIHLFVENQPPTRNYGQVSMVLIVLNFNEAHDEIIHL